MKGSTLLTLPLATLVAFSAFAAPAGPTSAPTPDLWALAQRHRAVHRFSTLFTAQNVREYFSSDARLREAIDWCKRTAVTKVYIDRKSTRLNSSHLGISYA